MEHAPLRPVPARPAGPMEPAAAVREVGPWVPELDPVAARALALVALAERPRAEVADSLGVSAEELAALLANARKELRQTIVVLGGSGWCERAEGLISDRLDGVLADRDLRRLDVHLRNCTRCVEHERRLVQATDALMRGLGGRPAPVADPPPAPLAEAPAEAEPPAGAEPPAHDGGEEEAAPPAPAPEPPGRATRPAAPSAPTDEQIAAAAEVLVVKRTRGQIAAAIVWNSMIALSILLALVTIAVTIIGILGGKL